MGARSEIEQPPLESSELELELEPAVALAPAVELEAPALELPALPLVAPAVPLAPAVPPAGATVIVQC